jgi:molecular chaperone GrpE (heat shock protein)
MKIHQTIPPLPPSQSATLDEQNTTHTKSETDNSEKTTNTHQLSEHDRKQLNNREKEEQADSKKNDLPQHIQKMLEQIEKIKEQIDQEKQRLVELKARSDLNDQVKQDMLLQQANQVAQLQTQLFSMAENVKEALKSAGINNPGVLIRAMA